MSPASAIVVAAPASGAGKTTITLGLLRHFRNRGLRVASAKVGPDYIDPQFHALASGRPCFNLDPWAMRPETLAACAAHAASAADILLIEGVMGLFDGANNGAGSTAQLAARLQLPVVLVVDAHAQAQSAAAVVYGFQHFRNDVQIAGVIFNRVGGPKHARLLRSAVEPLGVPVLAAIPEQSALRFPDRHLGLVQPAEHANIDAYLDGVAGVVGAEFTETVALASLAAPLSVPRTSPIDSLPPLGKRIAVAADVAFAFSYAHVLAGWKAHGAAIMPFSPLADEAPDTAADAIYLPGGYPELHAERLSNCGRFLRGLRDAASRGTFIYGECGGYMVLGSGLIDAAGRRFGMADLLPLETSFAKRRLHLGYRTIELLAAMPLGGTGARFRGHEFHYASVVSEAGDPFILAGDSDGCTLGRFGLRKQNVMGSFLHLIDRE